MPARLAAVLLLLALVLAACFGDDAPLVEVEAVTSGQVVATVSAPAQVEAAARQDVASSISGVVAALEAPNGGEVGAGQVVVRLDSAQVALAQEQARAAQAAAASGGQISVDGSGDATRAQTAAAVAELDATVQPQLADARAKAAAIQEPTAQAVATAAIDAAEASYLATRTGIITSGRAVAAQQEAIADSIAQALNQAIDQATAAQQVQADLALATAQAQAGELVLAAPFAGTVQYGSAAASDGASLPAGIPPELAGAAGALGGLADGAEGGGTLRVGAPVVAGQTLFTVFDLSQVYVSADIDEIDAPEVAVGQDAIVLVDAFGDVEFDAVVDGLQVEADTTQAGGVGYPARIRLLGPADPEADVDLSTLRVGMTASAEIVTETVDADLVVPSRALLRREGGTIVFVLRDDDRVEGVLVEVEVLGTDVAAVTGDLSVDDRVIVSGYEDLQPGDAVRTR